MTPATRLPVYCRTIRALFWRPRCRRSRVAATRGLTPASPFWQPLEARQAPRDLVESLFVDGVDRHLRAAEQAGIVERADLQDHGRHNRRPRHQMRAAFGAKVPRHGAFKIAAPKLFGRPRGIAEAVGRHQDKHVGRAAGDILALAAMALRLHHRLALGHIAHLAAIASAFQFHDVLPGLVTGHFDASGLALAIPFLLLPGPGPFAFGRAAQAPPQKRKGLQLALEPLNGSGIAGYVPEP